MRNILTWRQFICLNNIYFQKFLARSTSIIISQQTVTFTFPYSWLLWHLHYLALLDHHKYYFCGTNLFCCAWKQQEMFKELPLGAYVCECVCCRTAMERRVYTVGVFRAEWGTRVGTGDAHPSDVLSRIQSETMMQVPIPCEIFRLQISSTFSTLISPSAALLTSLIIAL